MSVIPAPMGLIAELTHRCPLQCAYCSNPLEMVAPREELTTAQWLRVIDEAADIGILQLHLTGGEPMARPDLPKIVAHAAARGLYTNLITSGVLLTDAAMADLLTTGIDHIQLSFQGAEASAADSMGGYKGGHARKLDAARRIREAGLTLTTNFVIHRRNIADLPAMLAMGENLGSDRIEIAHTQYYGWALKNRAALLPTREQLERATTQVEAARERLMGRVVIDYVVPDYYAERPKACMGGWGRLFIHLLPSGKALPCHAAETIPGISFASVRDTSLAEVWQNDPAFNRFRATGWMPEPCKSCDRREIDWGGCRCQALALLGDASATDPVCDRSPDHPIMAELVAQSSDSALALGPRRLRGG